MIGIVFREQTTPTIIDKVINIGELSFADMQLVMTAAATLTSPQVRYISAIGDDTVTFTEL